MYKVVRKDRGKRVSCVLGIKDYGIGKEFIREYSTKTPAKDGFIFKTLDDAKNFIRKVFPCHNEDIEIWTVKVSSTRKISFLQNFIDNTSISMYDVKKYFLRKQDVPHHSLVYGYLKGTRYARNILLVEKVK